MRTTAVQCQENRKIWSEWTARLIRVDWKGWGDMDVGMAVVTAIVVIVPFFALALASIRWGIDSRPGIDERDHRPWLVG